MADVVWVSLGESWVLATKAFRQGLALVELMRLEVSSIETGLLGLKDRRPSGCGSAALKLLQGKSQVCGPGVGAGG